MIERMAKAYCTHEGRRPESLSEKLHQGNSGTRSGQVAEVGMYTSVSRPCAILLLVRFTLTGNISAQAYACKDDVPAPGESIRDLPCYLWSQLA